MKRLTPIKAIKANCLDCMCGSYKEVKLCPIKDCPLFPYRFGHHPLRKGMISPKTIEAGKKALAKLRKRRKKRRKK